MTVANVVIASQLSYRAVEHMDTVQFCGQTCHVMKPEFTAHAAMPPHQAVACAESHIAPGATGWLKAKMNGTSQLMGVMFNNFPRPIESAMENNKLVSSAETCEQCHARDKPIGPADVVAYIRTLKNALARSPSAKACKLTPGWVLTGERPPAFPPFRLDC